MVRNILVRLAIGVLALAIPSAAVAESAGAKALVIAHRGASGDRPEHTLAAYELAIDQGADYIEPDLVVTKDLVLIARHETELSGTTDIASRDEFEDRRRDKMIGDQRVAGWFAEDFTLEEIRTLRVRERVPSARPANSAYDGLYQIPTFDEIVQLVRAKEAETGRTIGLYPELKIPTWLLQEEGIDTVDLLATQLRNLELDGADASVFVQVFEIGPLQRLNQLIDTKLVLLVAPDGGPFDEPDMRWSDIISPSGLTEVAEYADGIGPWLGHVLKTETMQPTSLVADAHAAGLQVHPWTLRKENGFLPTPLQNGGGPAVNGKYRTLWLAAIASGADGFFTDNVAEFVELTGQGATE
ncbi:MAG: glycerophosphodiester phosphodiesterase family protein [Pseudomonadota bacterium]